jgi:hypothetical protein
MTDMFDPWPGMSADRAVCGVQLMLVDYVRKSLDGLGVNLDELAVRAVALVVAKGDVHQGGQRTSEPRPGWAAPGMRVGRKGPHRRHARGGHGPRAGCVSMESSYVDGPGWQAVF